MQQHTFGGQGSPQQQETFPFAGFVEEYTQRQGGKTGTFWKLKIGGQYYNDFGTQGQAAGVNVGSYVEGTYTLSQGKYKNLQTIQVMQAPERPPQGQYQGNSSGGSGADDAREGYWNARAQAEREKNLHIMRESAWKSANGVVANLIAAGTLKPKLAEIFEVTKNLAHQIEQDIGRSPDFTTPQSQGDKPVKEEDIDLGG